MTLCKENNIPVLVFNVMGRGNVLRAALGHNVGTVVSAADADVAMSALQSHALPVQHHQL